MIDVYFSKNTKYIVSFLTCKFNTDIMDIINYFLMEHPVSKIFKKINALRMHVVQNSCLSDSPLTVLPVFELIKQGAFNGSWIGYNPTIHHHFIGTGTLRRSVDRTKNAKGCKGRKGGKGGKGGKGETVEHIYTEYAHDHLRLLEWKENHTPFVICCSDL